MKVAVIGGGAAGFFSAINAKENFPEAQVVIYEKSTKLLSKVKVSGGGRCNVTNGCASRKQLLAGYPRGQKLLKKAFFQFDNLDTIQWFEKRGVNLKTENDLRVFPTSDQSQSVIDCLMGEVDRLGIVITKKADIRRLSCEGGHLVIDKKKYDKVIVASGGSPKREGLDWLEELGHTIETPVPSLFTFNMPRESIKSLMGLVVKNALVRVQSSKLSSSGPLLITHWGMSGPAILKLSSFGARELAEKGYRFNVQVNWTGHQNHEDVIEIVKDLLSNSPEKKLQNIKPFDLPDRLWQFLLQKIDLAGDQKCGELGKKGINQLVNLLSNDIYEISGKTTFKEEFVTCGGVSLDSINNRTLESKSCPNLYFAGEVLDVDGVTGGYNFQAAWTTGFIAGQLL